MNNLNDLNEVLFKQLEALDDPNMTDEEFDKQIVYPCSSPCPARQ